MKRNDVIGGAFFLGVGILFAAYSRTVDIGTMEEPGPGFLPLASGILLAVMAAVLLGKAFFAESEKGERFFPEPGSGRRVLMVVLALIGYNFLLRPLGFILVTFLFVAFLVRYIFPQTWPRTLITAVLTTAGAQLVFARLLEIQFPRGLLGF